MSSTHLPVALAPAAALSSPPFAQLFAEHAPSVWRMLRNLGVPEVDLQDACQETFVIVYRKLPDFRGESSLSTWICGICLRVAAARRRRAHTRYEVPVAEFAAVAVSDDLEDGIDLRRAHATLQRILLGLDEAKRQVFVLYEIEQLPMAEIAQAMRCPLRTAYSRLEAARREVMQAWKREMLKTPRKP